jgi:transposase
VRARNETIEKLDRKIELLLERLELLRHQRFGPKADRISREQLALFDEAELNVLIEELDAQIAEAKAPPRSERTEPKQTPKRKPLPAHLPRVERILDLPEDEQAAIAATHVRIGFDESEQLGVLPKQYYVIKIKRAKYAPIHADVAAPRMGSASRPARRRSCPRPWRTVRCSPRWSRASSSMACRCTARRRSSPARASSSPARRCPAGSCNWPPRWPR